MATNASTTISATKVSKLPDKASSGHIEADRSGAPLASITAGKFLEFAKKAIKVVGAGKDNSTLSTIAGLSDQVTGLKLGFDMKK